MGGLSTKEKCIHFEKGSSINVDHSFRNLGPSWKNQQKNLRLWS